MSEQNFKNHAKYVPLFHFVAFGGILISLIGSIVNIVQCTSCQVNGGNNLLSASLICLLSFVLLLVAFFARAFALKAQDRAIRAEENLRFFVATGKLHDRRLRMGQIIALRFASDEEFVSLAKKAVDENLTAKQIKMEIKAWKADNYRL